MPSTEELGFFFNPNNLVTVFAWTGILAAIYLLYVAVKKGHEYIRSKDPIEVLRKEMTDKLEDHAKKLDMDKHHFDSLENRLSVIEHRMDEASTIQKRAAERSEENFKVLASSLSAMLGHMITGNGIDELKATQHKLTDYFINGKKSDD